MPMENPSGMKKQRSSMAITAKEIAELRAKTGMGMMECKKALLESDGDEQKALEILKKRGADKAAQKSAERTVKSGLVETYSHDGKIGVLVELGSETDFVARNEEFKKLAHDIALQVAAMNPTFIAPENIPADIIEKEKADYLAEAKNEGKPEEIAQKIADGKLEKYYSEVCLTKQPFIKDQDKTIEDLINELVAKIGEKIVISRFARFELGVFE